MTERRGSRFLLEVLFLVALATTLTLTHLRAIEIAGVMLVGWVIVAAFEWAAWRGEPHYGSGLPPRYYVPSVSLPPAQPLEQVALDGYPDASRDEAPTWIASAALRSEMLGEWPVAAPAVEAEPPVALPPVSEPESWAVAETELDTQDPVPGTAVAEPPPAPTIDVVLARSAQGVARHSLDPLAEPAPRRRFSRGGPPEATPAVEVPARPAGVRSLPGRSGRQD
jgi:hypothetical protein